MELALGCSMRIGEVLGLTWDCVHMEEELVNTHNAYLTVEKELRRCNKENLEQLRQQGRDDVFFTFPPMKKTESTTVLVLKTPKTKSSVRNIFLPEIVVLSLRQMKRHQEEIKAVIGREYQDFNLVVAQDNGRPYEERLIADKLNALIAAENLRPVVFHSLRHSSTSLKLKLSGGDIKAVQGDTGHAQANMVTDVYSHIMNEDRRRLAEKVNDEFFSPQKRAEPPENASEKAPEPPSAATAPPMDPSTAQLIELCKSSPELADTLLKMSKLLGGL